MFRALYLMTKVTSLSALIYKTQTKWDLIDEVYEMAMGWIATEEEMYDILFPAQIA